MTAETGRTPLSDKALHYRSYRLFWFASAAAPFAANIISVAVGWQIYDITRNPLFLGYVGLAQFLPALVLVLVTGLAADTFPRRLIMAVCLGVEVICAGILLLTAFGHIMEIWPIYVALVMIGTARAFIAPAASSLAPNLVPPEALGNALTLNATAWQSANIVGPAIGGLLYGIAPGAAYGTAAVLMSIAGFLILSIPKPPQARRGETKTLETLLAGFRYIWREKIVLGAISLDMFAVLLGGAVALLPVYARDILEVGPLGLGLLRAAPGIGGIAMALYLQRFPVRDHAGHILLVCVALFGLFTVVFGVSTAVWLSIGALLLMGAFDMVSVVLRETLIQLWTPDQVRGRVSAVNAVFIGASNELGEFRAGLVAARWGTVFAVAIGGAGTMMVAGLWSAIFPSMRKQRRIDRRGV
ncbi:MAG: MFS transporter [Alphaproteobacteria bacterium]|nr:MFS transporter [Alphaproteobacteria bacterium]